MTVTIVLGTEPVIRPPRHSAHCRLAAFPIVLRRERENRGLSRAALAGAAGIGTADVVDLEVGAAQPALEVVFALADGLGTDAADLLHETRRAAEELVADACGPRRQPSLRRTFVRS